MYPTMLGRRRITSVRGGGGVLGCVAATCVENRVGVFAESELTACAVATTGQSRHVDKSSADFMGASRQGGDAGRQSSQARSS